MLSMERIFSRICIPCACLILSAKALYVDRITKLNTEITIRGDEDSANNFLSIRFGAGDLDSTFDIIQKGGIYEIVSKATSKEMESVDVTLATKDLEGGQYMEISWRKSASSEFPLEDCIDLGSDRTWLTGQERYYSYYGSNKTYGVLYDMQPFISNDMVAKPALFGGVLEGLWFTSDGWAISSSIVEHDMPLWMSFNSNERGRNGSLCLRSDWGGIYGSNKGRRTNLEYKVCKYANIRETWTADVRRRFDYIPNSPSEDLILKPVWSTWANFKKDVNQSAVLSYADTIIANGYPYSTIEIDDMWSTFYGDLAFDSKKFSNPKELIATLHSKGFKVMLWIVPFCDQNATVYQEGSDHHYWVMESNDSGKLSPVGVKWWSNKEEGSAVLDVTNPHAVRWFVKRLQNFANEFGIDGFKLDAGEIEYIPPPALQNIYYYDEEALGNGSQLLRYTQLYSSIVDEVSNHAEVRAAWQHQDTSQLLRVMDLDSKWGHDNGLEAMISRVLLFSTIGYRYTLPDMIGGNGYGPDGSIFARETPPPELYVRWLQANVLMPMQLSIPPWRYIGTASETQINRVAKRIFEIRELLIEDRILALNHSISTGMPMIKATWMDTISAELNHIIGDQYMLGECIIVAPILKNSTLQRDVYLPKGNWQTCYSSRGPLFYSDGIRPILAVTLALEDDPPCYRYIGVPRCKNF